MSSGEPGRPVNSILEHLRGRLGPYGTGVVDDVPLPDELQVPGELAWAPGARDGVLGLHVSPVPADAVGVDRLVWLLLQAAAPGEGSAVARSQLYLLARGGVRDLVGPLLDRLAQRANADPDLLDTARWLAFEGRHSEPVKLGIVLLGLGHGQRDRANLLVLGRHAEFTAVVSATLTATLADPDPELFELAKASRGWARFHLVRRLQRSADPDIRRWAFVTGWRSGPDPAYCR